MSIQRAKTGGRGSIAVMVMAEWRQRIEDGFNPGNVKWATMMEEKER